MNGKLILVMGCPGAGKSTFLKNHVDEGTIISRDEVRYSMVSENEEYFSKEKAVFKEFVKQIQENLAKGINVYADATHLTQKSRHKLLAAIKVEPSETDLIWINTSEKECIKHNENRIGTRGYVPEDVLHRMFLSIQRPNLDEGFDKIYIIAPNKPIEVREYI